MRKTLIVIMAMLAFAPQSFANLKPGRVTVVKGANGKKYYTGLVLEPENMKGLGKTFAEFDDCDNLPDEFDLRDYGVVPPIHDQGSCGSCWTFSKSASLESALSAANGSNPQDLSEQELVSCDKQNWGCQGGLLNQQEYQVTKGQGLESVFPYVGRDVACKQIAAVAKATRFVHVGTSSGRASDKQVMCAIYKTKTIPWIVVSAGDNWAQFPQDSDGVVSTCRNSQPNHAVGLVGWKKVNGQVYFKMRNSWGNSWGSDAGRPGKERGYAMMKLGCDQLGYEVAYAEVAQSPQPPTPGPTPPEPTPGPTPGPCTSPVVKLPMFSMIRPNDTVVFAVSPQNDTTYSWKTADGKVSGTGSTIRVAGLIADTVLTVTAKNSCATAQSSMKIMVMDMKNQKRLKALQ